LIEGCVESGLGSGGGTGTDGSKDSGPGGSVGAATSGVLGTGGGAGSNFLGIGREVKEVEDVLENRGGVEVVALGSDGGTGSAGCESCWDEDVDLGSGGG